MTIAKIRVIQSKATCKLSEIGANKIMEKIANSVIKVIIMLPISFIVYEIALRSSFNNFMLTSTLFLWQY